MRYLHFAERKLTSHSEQSKLKSSRHSCHFKSSQLSVQQVQLHVSNLRKNSLLSRPHGQIPNTRPTHIFFRGKPRLSKPHERQAPFLRSKFSHDDTPTNTDRKYQFLARFQTPRQVFIITLMVLQCRAAAFPHTIPLLSETPPHTPILSPRLH